MIPKKLHYVWLSGDPFPDNIKRCLDSWKEILPEYEIKQWNTTNFDISLVPWVKEAYEHKKYAFATDYIRFYALYHEGGIYLDSDVEVIRSFNDVLDAKFFFGYEYTGLPEAAVIGSVAGEEWLRRCFEWYADKHLYADGKFQGIVCPMILRKGFETEYPKFQLIDIEVIREIDGGMVYPYFYFSPKNGFTGDIISSNQTYCIHHFNSAWLSGGYSERFRSRIHMAIIWLLGKKRYNQLIYSIREGLHKV